MHSRRAAPHTPVARLWAIVTGGVRCPAPQSDFRRLPGRRRPRHPDFCRPGAPLRQADKRQSPTSTGALCLRGGRLPPVAPAAHNRLYRTLRDPLGRRAEQGSTPTGNGASELHRREASASSEAAAPRGRRATRVLIAICIGRETRQRVSDLWRALSDHGPATHLRFVNQSERFLPPFVLRFAISPCCCHDCSTVPFRDGEILAGGTTARLRRSLRVRSDARALQERISGAALRMILWDR